MNADAFTKRGEAQPLFGEAKSEQRLAGWVVIGVLSLFACESATVAVVFGIVDKEPDHFALALVVLLAMVVAALLYRWFSVDELDGKYKWLVGASALLLLMASIATNVYVFQPKPVPQVLPPVWKCPGFFNPATNTCFPGDTSKCGQPDFCFFFHLQTCLNCTVLKPTLPPTPPPLTAPPS